MAIQPRYFALVIEDTRTAPTDSAPSFAAGLQSSVLLVAAATELGDLIRESHVLPEGCRVTRSIAITKELATKAW